MIKEFVAENYIEKNKDGFDRLRKIKLKDGNLVFRAYCPRGYTKKNGEKDSAWLPEILAIKPKGAGVTIYDSVFAPSPTQVTYFQLQPTFSDKLKSDDLFGPDDKKDKKYEIFHLFLGSFISEEDIGHIAVRRIDATGFEDDNKINPGIIGYSGTDSRGLTLHGEDNDLEEMIRRVMTDIPENKYNVKFSYPCCANGDKIYKIKIKPSKVDEFVEKAIKSLK